MYWSKRVGAECPTALEEAELVSADLARSGRTPMLVAVDGDVIGVIAVADELRADTPAFIAAMRSAGVGTVVMLTGDNRAVADHVASLAGIEDVRAGLLPEDKLLAVKALQEAGHTVAMLGDGVNDAPALATADVGVALGAIGSPVAIETADVALMTDRLDHVPEAVALGRRTVRIIRQNMTIALGLKAVFFALALADLATLWMAVVADMGASLIVIANGLRLLGPWRRDGRRAHHGLGA